MQCNVKIYFCESKRVNAVMALSLILTVFRESADGASG